MSRKAVITINRPRTEVEQFWRSQEYRSDDIAETEAAVSFVDAPGDRGTEVHVTVESDPPGGKLGEMAKKLTGSEPLAKTKDALRRFKQMVETGEIPRSDGTPEGESLERKLKQRPAQPLDQSEIEKAGV
ncbi:MAG TPA: hypothetical protein VE523_06715 [Solirubrobacterales bacterium]|jgi:uncharacterized membrane protein|nr:hypothetical protein [Solirubrobacterales bacterium]